MRTIRWLLVATALLVMQSACAQRERALIPGDYVLVSSAKVSATVQGAGGTSTVSGTLVLNWHYTSALRGQGKIELRAARLLLEGLPRDWNGPTPGGAEQATEDLGLQLRRPAREAVLVDFDGQTIKGEIPIQARYVGIDSAFPPPRLLSAPGVPAEKPGEAGDVYVAPRQSGSLKFEVRYDAPLASELAALDKSRRTQNLKATFTATATILELPAANRTVQPFMVTSGSQPLNVSASNSGSSNTMGSLCVQPVKVANAGEHGRAGRGLAFGKPEANTEWRKANVVIDWQKWKTVNDPALRVIDDDAELLALMAKVQNPNCTVVFFIEQFADRTEFGGGKTFDVNPSGKQIVTSDILADVGQDKTHLAHELGHVLLLGHPGDADPDETQGSTGTLMCPSGFGVDNPKKNSKDNENNLDTSRLGPSNAPRTGVADCQSSGSGTGNCGGC